jgi:hypothetical protein
MRMFLFSLLVFSQVAQADGFQEPLTFEKGQLVHCRIQGNPSYGAVFSGLGNEQVKLNAITNNEIEGDDKAEILNLKDIGEDYVYMFRKKRYEDLGVGSLLEIVFLKRKTVEEPLSAVIQFVEFTIEKDEETNFRVVGGFSYSCELK